MAGITTFYQNIISMVQHGAVVLDGKGPYGLSTLLTQLRLSEIQIHTPEVSPLFIDGRFELTGRFPVPPPAERFLKDRNTQKDFRCRLQVTGDEEGFDCTLQAEFQPASGTLLNDIYPPAKARIAENFYARPVDLFQHTYISRIVITGDTKKAEEPAGLSLTLYYTESCPFYKLYAYFLPDPLTEIRWKGTADAPFGSTAYVLQATYNKSVALPFLTGDIPVTQLYLTLWSDVKDIYALNSKSSTAAKSTMCKMELAMNLPLPALSGKEATLSYNLFEHSQNFFLKCVFGEPGLSAGDAFRIVSSLTGKQDLAAFPEWIHTDTLTLKGMVLRFEKDICAERDKKPSQNQEDLFYIAEPSSKGLFLGGAFYFDLELPSLPVPFFDKSEEGGARIRLTVQWDSLDIGGQLTIYVGFLAFWRRHQVLLNIDIPSLFFVGEYRDLEAGSPESTPYGHTAKEGNSIFPGFMDLSVKDIRVTGSVRNNTYALDFDLAGSHAHYLPIGKALFQIKYIQGSASYAPNGMTLSLELGITLFTAYFSLYAEYARNGGELLLNIQGGLLETFYLSNLLARITGAKIETNAADFSVSALYLTYVTMLPGDVEHTALPFYAADSLGTVQEFSFLCTIAFSWISGAVESTFHIHYQALSPAENIPPEDDGNYTYKISARLVLLDSLLFSASCTVLIAEGTYSFENFEFRTKIRTIEVSATYADANKNLTFTLSNFNMGELLEGLIHIFNPAHNWYLPWPFKIIKQITLKELAVFIDTKNETLKARYFIRFKLLFLEIEYIELYYNHGSEDFWVNLKIKAGNEQNTAGEKDLLRLNLLKDIFPDIAGMGSQLLDVNYLAVGQHIEMEIPSGFEEASFSAVLETIKKTLKKSGRPILNFENNWIFALQLKLIKAVNLTVLLCDPCFYGAELSITRGSEFTNKLAGLKVTILYSKINETLGMFHAKLTLPEVFRVIDIGAIQLRLGEIGLFIYTNGNFKIDLGFPYQKDFSRSFGLTYLSFTGKGGVYFGMLNGDTSKSVPLVPKGHFESVLELGIGISAGVSREIAAGPLKAGAYVMVVALFQGVFATYVPQEDTESSYYYKVQATAGVTASVYGCVDFALIKAGFSINASFLARLTLERYEKTVLALDLDISVEAYIKIFFFKINFHFCFHWQDTIELGVPSVPPWKTVQIQRPKDSARAYSLVWYDGAVFENKKHLFIDVIPYFSYNHVSMNTSEGSTPKIAFLGILNGFQENSHKSFGYARLQDTPLPVLAEALLRRLFLSVRLDGTVIQTVDRPLLEWLHNILESPDIFTAGFHPERIEHFLTQNVYLNYAKGDPMSDQEVHGIPFPLPGNLLLTWFSAPDREKTFDLGKDPLMDADFFQRTEEYYGQLHVNIPEKKRKTAESGAYSASTYLFTHYFYMLSKIILSVVISDFPEDVSSVSVDALVERIRQETLLDTISGMISRFCYGGVRGVINNQKTTESLYSYACQQFDAMPAQCFSPGTVIHSMKMEFFPESRNSFRLLRRADYLNSSNRLPEYLYADSGTVLKWEFRAEDLTYPAGTLCMKSAPLLQPFYAPKPRTIEMKNPNKVAGQPSITFWETAERLPKNFSVVYPIEKELKHEISFTAGTLLYIPVYKIQKNTFGLGCIGMDNILRLNALKSETDLTITLYRLTNPLDTEHCGFAPLVSENVCLYRTNLCLEAEKPLLARPAIDTPYTNSASLKEALAFISLLSDAALVNSKGYYLQFEPDQPHAIQDGEMSLVLFVSSHFYQDAVKLSTDSERETEQSVVLTKEFYQVPVYEPGTLAFAIPAEVPDDDLKRAFQMLRYQIAENAYFWESNESPPLLACPDEFVKEKQVFSQIVPACRFARNTHNPGSTALQNYDPNENPYRGIVENSILSLRFSLLDILGNESNTGLTFHIPYGYTDRLISPTTYPYTKCTYYIEDGGAFYDFYLDFVYTYQEGSQEDKKQLIKIAFWQVMCEDVRLSLHILGTQHELDLTPLRDYLGKIYLTEEEPSPVQYHAQIPKPADDITAIDCRLTLSRKEILLAESLKNTPEAKNILQVCQPVRADEQKIKKSFLAKRGSDGQLFLIKNYPLRATSSSGFTLPPLCNKLLQLKEMNVFDMDGTQRTESFCDIDLELWADCFLYDLENFLSPASAYSDDRELMERLLQIKEGLAAKISALVTPVTKAPVEEAFYKKAKQFYKNEMLRSIYSGKKLDMVYLSKTDPKSWRPAGNSALLFTVKEESIAAALKTGKVENDGLIPLGVRAMQIEENMRLQENIKLTVTDIEVAGDRQYEYLTLLKTEEQNFSLDCTLPCKRFPGLPVLLKHDYKATHNRLDYLGFSYSMTFSHEAAEQDCITVRLLFGSAVKKNNNLELPEALAQYMHLRDEFLQPQKAEPQSRQILLKVCQKILDSWSSKETVEKSEPACYHYVTFYMDRHEKRLHLSGTDLKPEQIEIQMLRKDHILETLERQGGIYKISNAPFVRPYVFCFWFHGFQIQTENSVNSCVSVSRNQNIRDILPCFVYRTEEVSFPQPLLPWIQNHEIISLGNFERDNFIRRLKELMDGFSRVKLELYCGIRISKDNLNDLYSYLPMFYVPQARQEEGEKILMELYEKADAWINKHFEVPKEGTLVRVSASLYHKSSGNRNLAEFSSLVFYLNTGPSLEPEIKNTSIGTKRGR